jgi:protocatechuate 3,4-dioxygenase, alpha subunit
MIGPDTKGEPVRLRLRVLDGAGAAAARCAGRVVAGRRERPLRRRGRSRESRSRSGLPRLGTPATDRDGWCEFNTIRPGATTADGRQQAPHINVCLFARGHAAAHLHAGVLRGRPDDRRPTRSLRSCLRDVAQTLVAEPIGRAWVIMIRLQGAGETVFFDL